MTGPSTTNAWRLLATLTLAYVLSFLDRQFLAVAIEPIRGELGLTDIQMGLLAGLAFAVFYSVLGVPMGMLSDRTDRTKVIAACIAVWSIATACCGLARNFNELFAARMFVGIGEAGLLPAAYSLIGDRFERTYLPQATGILIAGGALGNGLAVLGGGPLVEMLHPIGAFASWRQIFIGLGLAGILVTLAVLRLSDPRAARGANIGAVKGDPRALVAFLRANAGFLIPVTLGASLLNIFFYGNSAWTPAFFMRAHSWDGMQVGLTYGLCILVCGIAAGPLWGRFGTIINRRGGDLIGILLAAAIAPLMLIASAGALSPSPWGSVALLGIIPLLAGGFIALIPALLVEKTPSSLRGQTMAFFFLCANLSGIGFGPLIYAWTTQNLLGGPQMLGVSLATVSPILLFAAGCLFWLARGALVPSHPFFISKPTE